MTDRIFFLIHPGYCQKRHRQSTTFATRSRLIPQCFTLTGPTTASHSTVPRVCAGHSVLSLNVAAGSLEFPLTWGMTSWGLYERATPMFRLTRTAFLSLKRSKRYTNRWRRAASSSYSHTFTKNNRDHWRNSNGHVTHNELPHQPSQPASTRWPSGWDARTCSVLNHVPAVQRGATEDRWKAVRTDQYSGCQHKLRF